MSNKMEKMNIIRSNGKYQIYNDEIKTYNALPPNIYKVFFNKMSGFYLSLSNDIEIDESKIYGNTPSRVDKALRSYQNMNRNFGVLLSGEKGVGKSLFVKKLAQENRFASYSCQLFFPRSCRLHFLYQSGLCSNL